MNPGDFAVAYAIVGWLFDSGRGAGFSVFEISNWALPPIIFA
jgi:hypothetical protein